MGGVTPPALPNLNPACTGCPETSVNCGVRVCGDFSFCPILLAFQDKHSGDVCTDDCGTIV